jgi:hypothetical protein
MSEQRKSAARRFLAKIEDYQRTFKGPHGERVLLDMIAAHFIMQPLPVNPNERDRAEGERNVVLRILSKLKVDPAKVQKLIQEADTYVSDQSNI